MNAYKPELTFRAEMRKRFRQQLRHSEFEFRLRHASKEYLRAKRKN